MNGLFPGSENLHDRVSRILLTTGAILSAFALILGVAFGGPFYLQIPHIVVLFICVGLPRIFPGNLRGTSVSALYFVSYIYFPFIYFTNAGMDGTGPSFFIMIIVYFAFYQRDKRLLFTLGPLIIFYLVIIWLSFLHPEWVMPYPDVLTSYIDKSVGFVSVAVVMAIAANTTYREYETQHRNAIDLASDLAKKNHRLQRLSNTDQLTGVYNRSCLQKKLEQEIHQSKNQKKDFFLLMLDIDYFKRFNDTYGHLIGDEILILIARQIKHSIREHDMVARYGGEEFLILVSHSSNESGLIIAERIRKGIEAIRYRDVEAITVSIGVAGSREAETSQALIQLADDRMYRAKRNGRNRVYPRPL